jgi:hypothetical protein
MVKWHLSTFVRLFGETYPVRDDFERLIKCLIWAERRGGTSVIGGVSLSEITVIITLIDYASIPSCRDSRHRAMARTFP